MKGTRIVLLSFLLLWIGLHATAYAKDDTDVVVSIRINDPQMTVNGVQEEIDPGRGTVPIIQNSRTLVPIRAIVEAFGGQAAWEESSRRVTLTMEEDVVCLTIDSTTAYCNNRAETLETAPVIINGRTLLPLRFVAESFNLGVGWDGSTQQVFVVRNGFDDEEYKRLMAELKPYSGTPSVTINENIPYFKEYEKITGSFEFYATLDELKRCDVCFSSVAKDLMPVEERKSISSVKPTGWVNNAYEFVPGRHLYNRCHLIGFQLTGENANKRNLITGTRYMNVDGMLPYENRVADYVKATGNHVVYRVTPVFSGNHLVADGVLMEAYSVEDGGAGVSFCVFCYNVQPRVVIDYATGENRAA